MFSVKKLSIITVGTVAIGLGSVAPVTAASLYNITGLSFLPSDINDSAQVVGQNYLWQNGNVIDLTTLPGANNSPIFATSINNKGAIVGGGLTATGQAAFISDGNTISDLPITYCNNITFCSASVEDINDSGTVAISYDGYLGFIQQSDGTTTQLLSARGVFNIAVNNQDQVVGSAVFTGGSAVGLFSGNTTGRQTTLVAAAEPESFYRLNRSSANDINDVGDIVGSGLVSTSINDSALEATLWTNPSTPGVSLGTLGGENSEALGINNSQQIVGTSTLTDSSTQHAFLWEDGNLIDLNSLVDPGIGWELTSAFEINNNGDIIGIGNFNGEQRGFIAKAVPEPTSVLGVLGLGLFGLSNWRKRKK